MRKTLLALSLATGFVAPTTLWAADAASTPTHSFSPNVGVVSDYLFRGISQTHGAGALQGGVDYSHASGLYAGVWASTITWVKDGYGKGSTEIDVYGGYKNSFAGGDWTYDVGLIAYNYPGHGQAITGVNANPNTTEVYGAIGYKWLTLKYSHAVSSHFIGFLGNNGNTNTRGSNYLELNAAYDLGNGWGLSGHYGTQKVKNVTAVVGGVNSPSYSDWNIGVTKDVGFGVVGLSYSDTNVSGSCTQNSATNTNPYCWGSGNFVAGTGPTTGFADVSKGTVVLSFKKTF